MDDKTGRSGPIGNTDPDKRGRGGDEPAAPIGQKIPQDVKDAIEGNNQK